MQTTSYYKVNAITYRIDPDIDGLPSEIRKTFFPHSAREAFKEALQELKEEEPAFILTLSIVYDQYNKAGRLVRSQEQELERQEVNKYQHNQVMYQ
jgi:hypothetical protein